MFWAGGTPEGNLSLGRMLAYDYLVFVFILGRTATGERRRPLLRTLQVILISPSDTHENYNARLVRDRRTEH